MSEPKAEVSESHGSARAEAKHPGTATAHAPHLRDDEMRLAQDLMFFAYRDFTNAADVILEELGLGRAHHRALHFIGRNPGITVSDLLGILRITKQSLARVLNVLVERGYVSLAPGHADRRQRLLTLAPAGATLERRLFESQRERLGAAFREAGGQAVDGFCQVMRHVMDETARSYIETHDIDIGDAAARPARGRG